VIRSIVFEVHRNTDAIGRQVKGIAAVAAIDRGQASTGKLEGIVAATAPQVLDTAEPDIANLARAGAGYLPEIIERTGESEQVIVAGVGILEANRDYKGVSLVHREAVVTFATGNAYFRQIRKGMAGNNLRQVIVNDNKGIDRIDVIETQGKVAAAGGRGKGQVGRQQETWFKGFELQFARWFAPLRVRGKTFWLRQECGYQSFQLTMRKRPTVSTRLLRCAKRKSHYESPFEFVTHLGVGNPADHPLDYYFSNGHPPYG